MFSFFHPLCGHASWKNVMRPGRPGIPAMPRRSPWSNASNSGPVLRKLSLNVSTHAQCQQTKASRPRSLGFLMLLPVPKRPWQHIIVDFITQLPSSDGYDAIIVFVDQFTKMSIFALMTASVTSEDFTSLFFKHVYARQGIHDTLTMDCCHEL